MVSEPSHMPVYVIQCGTEPESEVIKYFQELIRSCRNPTNKLDLQFATYRDDQKHNRARIIHMDVEKYKKKGAFVIVFVSKALFDVVWTTPQKRTFLKMISIMKNCLHVWIDVNEEDVKRYSTVMIRKDLNFGRIHIDELTKGSAGDADAKMSLINTLLRTSSTRKNCLNNYACDDEIEEMKDRFLKATYADRKIDEDLLNNSCVATDFKSLNIYDKTMSKSTSTVGRTESFNNGRIGSTR